MTLMITFAHQKSVRRLTAATTDDFCYQLRRIRTL